MKNINIISKIVRSRLDELGLSPIPPSAVSYLEECMADDIRRIAANRISPRYVVHTILKALANSQHQLPY